MRLVEFARVSDHGFSADRVRVWLNPDEVTAVSEGFSPAFTDVMSSDGIRRTLVGSVVDVIARLGGSPDVPKRMSTSRGAR